MTSCGRSTRSIASTRRSGSTIRRSEARRRSCTGGSRPSPATAARADATQDPSLLGGCRVLDLADLGGAVCGRTLADLGADVVKVEPPGGEADRLQPPFVGDVENSDRSIRWIAANVNKRGVTCDLGSADGRALFAWAGRAGMTTVLPPSPVWWDIARDEHGRTGPFLLGRSNVGSRFRNLWACADGFVSFAIQGGPIGRHTGRMLAEWMSERGQVPAVIAAIDWTIFDNSTLPQAQVDELETAIAPFLRSLTKTEFFEGVIKRKMLGYPVSDASDSLADPQLRARDFWRILSPAEGLPALPFPGGFALFDGKRPEVRRPAPRVGEHNAEIYGEAGIGTRALAQLREAGVV